MSERELDFVPVPGVRWIRDYGIVCPWLTTNGSPSIVRSHLANRHPEHIPAFDKWVPDVMGWPTDWVPPNRR